MRAALPLAIAYVPAAIAEIAGSFSFWAWLRLDRSPLWLAPGMVPLAAFAWMLTQVDNDVAGRAYAAYGTVYICTSLAWLRAIEGTHTDRRNAMGAVACLAGASIVLLGPRSA